MSGRRFGVANISDAFLKAQKGRDDMPARKQESHENDLFGRGVDWVQNVLVPAINKGNEELRQHDIAFRVDLNLDRRSTNHAHADFWLSEISSPQPVNGPRYSINVIGGEDICLYKPGVPGRILGAIDRCGPDEVQALLREAAEEFGGLLASPSGSRMSPAQQEPRMPDMKAQTITLHEGDKTALQYLGTALVLQWSHLPEDVKKALLQQADSVGGLPIVADLHEQIQALIKRLRKVGEGVILSAERQAHVSLLKTPNRGEN